MVNDKMAVEGFEEQRLNFAPRFNLVGSFARYFYVVMYSKNSNNTVDLYANFGCAAKCLSCHFTLLK